MWHEDDLFFAFADPVKRDTFENTEDKSVFVFSLRLLFFFKPKLLFRPAVAVSLSFQRFFGDEHIRFCWKYIMRAFGFGCGGIDFGYLGLQ